MSPKNRRAFSEFYNRLYKIRDDPEATPKMRVAAQWLIDEYAEHMDLENRRRK